MQLKTLWFWFWTTLCLGTGTAVLLGFLLQTSMENPDWVRLLLMGSVFGAVAELGFFSYLVFNWLCRGFIHNRTLFHSLLALLILVVLGNLLYLLWTKYSNTYLTIVPVLVVVSGVVAWYKVKVTTRDAWIPTLFFMIVVTTLEAMTSINAKGTDMPLSLIFYTVTIFLVCNAWQILRLHHWVRAPEQQKSQNPSSG